MEPREDYRRYRTWFSLFLAVLLSGFFIAIIVYNGRFNPFSDPFSWLGASETKDGADNRASMAVFVIDMVICAVILGYMAFLFAKDRNIRFHGFRTLISIIGALGACIATFPNNYYLVQHQVGAGFLVGSLWLHANLLIADASRVTSKGYAAFLQIVLQSTVLTYAFTFFVDAPNRDVVQKFGIAGLAIAIELSLAALCREPVDATAVFRPEEIEETKAGH